MTPTAPTADAPISATTAAAIAFVETHLARARDLGGDLAELVDDPESFARRLQAGLRGLADETYRREQSRVAPGLDDSIGVRLPLVTAVRRAFDRASRQVSTDSLLWLAERLLREPGLEVRVLTCHLLDRVLPDDPERGWQILRDAARRAHEWITVDSLAHPYGLGILLEPVRWSEIEQLAYSPSRWERRLVGSTIATIPFVRRREGRQPEVAARALPIVANLIGDAEPDVQKALSWALRSLVRVDATAVAAFAEAQSLRAVRDGDGHRAWVVRDALTALPAADAVRIRARLAGVRRRPGAPATSDAAAIAGRFRTLIDETPRVGVPRRAVEPTADQIRTGETA